MAALTSARDGPCMVVLGDSVAQGCDDPDPAGGWIGWALRLAHHLHLSRDHVVNVAQRGAALPDVAEHQLPAVRHLRPDIVLLNCGMNDALHGFDQPRLDRRLDAIFDWVKDTAQDASSGTRHNARHSTRQDTWENASPGTGNGTSNPARAPAEGYSPNGAANGKGALVIAAAVPVAPLVERSIFSQFRRTRTRQRIEAINAELRRRSGRAGAIFLAEQDMPEVTDPALWSPDGIHLNAAGHAYVADVIIQVAGGRLTAQATTAQATAQSTGQSTVQPATTAGGTSLRVHQASPKPGGGTR